MKERIETSPAAAAARSGGRREEQPAAEPQGRGHQKTPAAEASARLSAAAAGSSKVLVRCHRQRRVSQQQLVDTVGEQKVGLTGRKC